MMNNLWEKNKQNIDIVVLTLKSIITNKLLMNIECGKKERYFVWYTYHDY